eukprot:jgi/Mesvir1/5333/Mv15422-RA.1
MAGPVVVEDVNLRGGTASAAPKDHFHAAYIIFFLLGAGILLPWNSVITAVDYFEASYPGRHPDRVFPCAYMPAVLIGLLLVVRLGHLMPSSVRILGGFTTFLVALAIVMSFDPSSDNNAAAATAMPSPSSDGTDGSSNGLVGGGSGTVGGSSSSGTGSNNGDGDDDSGSFSEEGSDSGGSSVGFVVTCASMAAMGLGDALAQGSIYGLAGQLPPRYTQAIMAGNSASGVLISLLRVVTKAALPATLRGLRASAMLYFAITISIIGVCMVGYLALGRLPVIRYHQKVNGDGAQKSVVVIDSSVAWSPGDSDVGRGRGLIKGGRGGYTPVLGSSGEDRASSYGSAADLAGVATGYVDRHPALELEMAEQEAELASLARFQDAAGSDHPLTSAGGPPSMAGGGGKKVPGMSGAGYDEVGHYGEMTATLFGSSPAPSLNVYRLAWQLRDFAVVLMGTYLITLSIFPGCLAENMTSPALGDWYPILLILAFNVADLVGKALPGLIRVTLHARHVRSVLVPATLARAGFIPVFILAARGPAITTNEGFAFLATFALGASNGYVSTVAMMAAPLGVQPHEAEAAGMLMVLFLVVGLTLGVLAGLLWML